MKVIGKFQKFNHPDDAEKYTLSDFTVMETIKTPSKIVEGLGNREIIDWFICPSCKLQHDELNHGDAYECGCGLKIQSFDNGLYLWK